ncbi:MAG TPA: hypothetical protein VK184_20455 [Nostocaceae cyanobacterium]|nr:hypothetical protein [Nostocaceae cyanobacterium]
MRYLINDSPAEIEERLILYRTVLSWAVRQSESFLLSLQPHIYDEETLNQISALGKVELIQLPQPNNTENLFMGIVKNLLRPLANKINIRIHNPPSQLLKIQGKSSENLINELTIRQAPTQAIADDLCPVEDVELFLGKHTLYTLRDYGRTQILNLTTDELTNLQQTLMNADLNIDYLVLAPKYINDTEL